MVTGAIVMLTMESCTWKIGQAKTVVGIDGYWRI
jgi:hypothetical protein